MRISEKEKVLLGYSRPPQSPYSDHISSPKTSNRSSDIDFSDVFGGPPKRASLQEPQSRYSGESSRGGADSNDETSSGRSSWSNNRSEKPVFGSETRRYPSGDFYDDIFRGEQSPNSSPRMDPSSSASGSRILPAGVESLGYPAESSLPARSESLHSSSSSMWRHSGQVVENHNVFQGGDDVSSYRRSPLSHNVSSKDEEPGKDVIVDESCRDAQVSNGVGLFHFSIHKWASKGVPLFMSLGMANSLRSKDKNKLESSLSSNGNVELENDTMVGEIQPADTNSDDFFVSTATERKEPDQIGDKSENDAVKLRPNDKVEDTGRAIPMGSVSYKDPALSKSNTKVEEAEVSKPDRVSFKSDLKNSSAELHGVENVAPEVRVNQKVVQVKLATLLDVDDGESVEELESCKLRESSGFEGANMRNDVDHQRNMGNDMYGVKVEETVGDDRVKEKVKNGMDKNGANGKVKDFVKIFNQEPSSKLTSDANCKSSRWGNTDVSGANSKPVPISSKKEEKIQSFVVNCRMESALKVGENHTSDGKQSHSNNAHEPGESSYRMNENLGSTSDLASEGSEAWSTSIDDIYGSFMVEELPEIVDKSPEGNENHEDTQALENKIRKWSKGKEGNIRALLSTLQYVLWPDSGWKPVPLVDIIEANAVKRSYQKALLRLHPDKLQQKGASLHHKFIAEKVFDILQEAWDHFNTLGPL